MPTITDPATGKVYEQLPGAKAGAEIPRSLTGTLSGTTSGTRSLPNPTAPSVGASTLPNPQGGSSLTNFAAAMKEMSRIAYSQKQSSADLLGQYSAAGVPMTTPGAIQGVLAGDTEQRAGRIMDVYKNTLAVIQDQEEKKRITQEENAAFGKQIFSAVLQNPALFASMSGQDFEDLKSGNISTEMIQKIASAAQEASVGKEVPSSYQEWQLAGGENSGYSYADWVKGVGAGTKFEPVKDKDGNTIGAFNPSTGETNYYQGGPSGGIEIVGGEVKISADVQQKIDSVNDLLNDENLNRVVGLGLANPLNFIPGTAAQMTIANFKQLQALLKLDKRQLLKGQGQISNFEAQMLGEAATSLSRKLSDVDARKVLTKIKTAFEMDAIGDIAESLGFNGTELKEAIETKGFDTIKKALEVEYQQQYPDSVSGGGGGGGGGGAFNSAQTQALKGSISQKFPQGSNGGQCTTWLHKVAEFPPIGDGKNEKIASVKKYGFTFKEQSPRVGDIIVTNENPTYGHTAMIIAINPDGTATLAESNYYQKSLGKEKVSYTRKISLDSPKIYGAIRPTKLKTLA